MRTSPEVVEIAKAMCAFQGDYEGAQKEGLNPHFKSRYITLDSIRHSIKPQMKLNGLSVMQDVTSQGNTVSVETRVQHISGQWMEFGPLTLTIGKIDPQAAGSGASYAERYALCAALGISAEMDDDGNAAMPDKHKSQEVKCETKTGQILNENEAKAKITTEQFSELAEIFRWIDPELARSITDRIYKKYSITHLGDIPAIFFPMIIKGIKEQTDAKKDES